MSFFSTISRIAGPGSGLSGDALRDLGLTRAEVQALQYARPETRQQLEAMARRFGLAPKDLSVDRWQELEISLNCAKCGKSRDCANFLTGRGSFDLGDCPNSGTYKALAMETGVNT